jgi:hypothetical protein
LRGRGKKATNGREQEAQRRYENIGRGREANEKEKGGRRINRDYKEGRANFGQPLHLHHRLLPDQC